jgi:hypothetical protein
MAGGAASDRAERGDMLVLNLGIEASGLDKARSWSIGWVPAWSLIRISPSCCSIFGGG